MGTEIDKGAAPAAPTPSPQTNVDLITLLRDARQTIALLTPFSPEDAEPILTEAINSVAEKADTMRARISAVLEAQSPVKHVQLIEDAAKLVEAELSGMEFDKFSVNGKALTNSKGHDLFLSVEEVRTLLQNRAAQVRAIATRKEQP